MEEEDVKRAYALVCSYIDSLGVDLDIFSVGLSTDARKAYFMVVSCLPLSVNDVLGLGIKEDVLRELTTFRLLRESKGVVHLGEEAKSVLL